MLELDSGLARRLDDTCRRRATPTTISEDFLKELGASESPAQEEIQAADASGEST